MAITARRAALVAAVCLVLAGAVAITAVVDHRHKVALMGPASVASWFCEHDGIRCDEPQADDVAGGWHRRERFYRAGFALLLAVGLGGALTSAGLVVRNRERRTQLASGSRPD
jgi:hypothetical protein